MSTETALYDVAQALLEYQARARADRDPVTAHTITIADELARYMARHFPDEPSRHTAGCALIIGGACLGALPSLPIEVVVNVAALAGQLLYEGGVG